MSVVSVRVAFAIGCVLAGVVMAGCQQKSSLTAGSAADSGLTADQILARVREQYAAQLEYSDRGALVLSYTLQGSPQEERHPFSVAYRRPAGEDLRIFHARLNRQQDRQSIAIFDPQTNNVDQQVLIRTGVDFDSALDLPDDPILKHFVSGQADLPLSPTLDLGTWLVPLPLALARGSLEQPWFLGRRERLDPSFIGGDECYRIRIDSKHGRVVAWIDAEHWLVRRLELPDALLNDQLLAKSEVENRRLVAEFENASWSPDADPQRLSWQPAKSMNPVRRFVSLPAPFPSELIGKRAREFQVEQLERGLLNSEDLRGVRTAWIWFSSNPICTEPLRQFNEVARQFSGQSQVRLFAVSTDLPSTQSNTALATLMKQWQIDVAEIVRDWKQVGKSTFDIQLLPTLVVMDETGKIQYFKVIEDGQVAQQLTAVLSRIGRGEDIANEMKTEYENYLKHYRRQLAEAAWTTDGRGLAITPTSFAPQRLPDRFQLRLEWELNDLVAPGNIGVVYQPRNSADGQQQTAQIAVLDGFQSLVEVSPQGQRLRRLDLGRDPEDSYTQVRGKAASDGVDWLVGAVLGSRLKLARFDGESRVLLDSPEAPIRDYLLIDGQSENDFDVLIGYWEGKGVVRITRQGKQVVALPAYPNIACLAATPATRGGTPKLLGTQREGGLFRAEFNLQAAEATELVGLQIAHVFTATQTKPGDALLCVLGLDDQGQVQARGLDETWRVTWQLLLSGEVFDRQVQFVQNGPLDRTTLWAIARPDGTIHLLTADGQFQDQFKVGQEITGLAVFEDRSRTKLLVSTPAGLQCWDVSVAEETARRLSDRKFD